MSNSIADEAKPIMWGEGLIIRTIIEPITPTMEAVPNLPVAQTTSNSVRKTAKSQNIGRLNKLKPKGPNVRLRTTHNAQKTLIKAMSTVVK
jgi:hypothetical protein